MKKKLSENRTGFIIGAVVVLLLGFQITLNMLYSINTGVNRNIATDATNSSYNHLVAQQIRNSYARPQLDPTGDFLMMPDAKLKIPYSKATYEVMYDNDYFNEGKKNTPVNINISKRPVLNSLYEFKNVDCGKMVAISSSNDKRDRMELAGEMTVGGRKLYIFKHESKDCEVLYQAGNTPEELLSDLKQISTY